MAQLKTILGVGALSLLALAVISSWLPAPDWHSPATVASQRQGCEVRVGIKRDTPYLYRWTKEVRALAFIQCMQDAGYSGTNALP